LRAITGDEVAQMKIDLALPDSDSLAPQNLIQVGKTLGADLVVLGSYVALSGGQLRLDLHLLDVAAGETLVPRHHSKRIADGAHSDSIALVQM
jgi:hypothetical protein